MDLLGFRKKMVSFADDKTTTFFVVGGLPVSVQHFALAKRVGLEETISGGCGYWVLSSKLDNFELRLCHVLKTLALALGFVCSLKKLKTGGKKDLGVPSNMDDNRNPVMSCEADHRESTGRLPHLGPAQRPHGVRHAAVAALGQFQVT